MWTVKFWKQTAERMIKTGAQYILLIWFVGDIGPVNAFSIDWLNTLGAFGAGAAVSLFTCIVSLPLGEGDSPSVVATE